MVRFHYGPWDLRYYDVLAFLSSRELIAVEKSARILEIRLTEAGSRIAAQLSDEPDYEDIVVRMKEVKKAFGAKSGSAIKSLIYETFKSEVGEKRLRQVIT